MFNKELSIKVDNIIKEKFPIIYDYKFDGIVLLYGGTIKNIIMGTPIKDLDFIILTQSKCQIVDFIRKFKLSFYRNAGGGYKISYNGFSIDISSTDDLLNAGIYDIDFLFYDLEKHMFISCGAINSLKTGIIVEVNDDKNALFHNRVRLKRLIKFIKYILPEIKKVKVKQNKLLWNVRLFRTRIRLGVNRTFNGCFKKCFKYLSGCEKEYLFMEISTVLMAVLLIFSLIFLNGLKMVENIFISGLILFLLLCLHKKSYEIFDKTMTFNICKEILNIVLNLDVSDDRYSYKELKKSPVDIARYFKQIHDVLFYLIIVFILYVYVFYLNDGVGIVLLLFIFFLFKIRITGVIKDRNFYRRKFGSDNERYTNVLGKMLDNVYEKELDKNIYQLKYNKAAFFVEVIAILITVLLSKNFVIFLLIVVIFALLRKICILPQLFSGLNNLCYAVFNLSKDNLYIKEIFGDKYKKKCNGKIEFSSVKFKYNYKNDYVLNDCTFKVEPNELVALVGKSGEGKSTVLNLIGRLYNVDQGSIKIDDIVIDEYSEEFIRENISIISQDPYLFDMSIKDNLKLVDEKISDKEIRDVCKLVCMDKYIESLPDKYDTIIGEGGIKLSGGQKQRLGIARALIKKTKIILLDEITSALDNETGSTIKKVIQNIKKNHTIILVTHELSMIKDCSRKITLANRKTK